MPLAISLDDGVTWYHPTETVRIIVSPCPLPTKNENVELHLVLTNEGLVQDVWQSKPQDQSDENLGTSSQTYDEMVEALTWHQS